ncbi:MAG TPA: DinB family protein [Thermoanaerobaculia bacterium]|nr:DinB family protein [Thermoanaerobaculia bacterium]
MILREAIRDLYLHMEWADAIVWKSVLASEAASSDPKTRELLYHIHIVQRAFHQLWSGSRVDVPEPSAFATAEAIRQWARGNHAELRSFLERLDEEHLDRPLKIPWAKRLTERFGITPQSVTQGESMFQVPAHSTYHRGQVNARLREQGAEPPLIDYIAWLWFGRPEAEW